MLLKQQVFLTFILTNVAGMGATETGSTAHKKCSCFLQSDRSAEVAEDSPTLFCGSEGLPDTYEERKMMQENNQI